MVQRKVRSEKLLARRVTHLPEKRPLRILIFLARDLATFLGAQSQSSQPLSVFTRASNLDARKKIHSGRLDRRARSISRIRSACIEVQRSSCVIMITTAQGTFGVLLVPKKCPALVNIKAVVSVRQVASGGGATDVGTQHKRSVRHQLQLRRQSAGIRLFLRRKKHIWVKRRNFQRDEQLHVARVKFL